MRTNWVGTSCWVFIWVATAASTALAEPEDLMFFTNFDSIVPNTAVGEPFDIGEGDTVATFSGDAFAGRVGVTQLYRSGLRAWMVNAPGTGMINFSTNAAMVEFYAVARTFANDNTVITAFDGNDEVVADPITITPGQSFQLVSFTGDIARIEVENLANGNGLLNGVDDFGFTPMTAMPPLPGDYNNSNAVEQGDLDLVLLHWGEDGSTPPEGWINDLPDGNIDQNELDGVLLNWGNTNVPAASSSVTSTPEPASWLLVVLCLHAAVVYLRR